MAHEDPSYLPTYITLVKQSDARIKKILGKIEELSQNPLCMFLLQDLNSLHSETLIIGKNLCTIQQSIPQDFRYIKKFKVPKSSPSSTTCEKCKYHPNHNNLMCVKKMNQFIDNNFKTNPKSIGKKEKIFIPKKKTFCPPNPKS